MTIPCYDVARANAPHRANLLAEIAAVLDDGALILGPRLDAFEAQFAAYCGSGHCIGVGNGLDALSLALQAVGVGPGDEVIVPAFTFIATWFSVSGLGARPVPVDVLDDGLIDPPGIAAAITRRTRAIVPVHLFGRLADMDAILQVAGAAGLPVIEDAAQAHGAMRGGRRAGSFGALAAFSFYPTKNLGALGDGGAVCTDDPALASRIRRLRNYGSTRKYHHDLVGRNSRLDDVQAAILTAKLPHLDAANRRRRAIAGRYREALHDAPGIALPPPGDDAMVWHQFVIRSARRDALAEALARQGIGAAIHYPAAPFDQPCCAGQHDRARFPMSCRLADTVLSLPMADYLSDAEVERVIHATLRAAARVLDHV
jgi:dTDP-3-amino-3,4,6-trideoxy-alpha-D-glucose transaminase